MIDKSREAPHGRVDEPAGQGPGGAGGKAPAPEPEKKLPGVPGHLQAAVQQLIAEPPAKKGRR